jgi:hypothetical protein
VKARSREKAVRRRAPCDKVQAEVVVFGGTEVSEAEVFLQDAARDSRGWAGHCVRQGAVFFLLFLLFLLLKGPVLRPTVTVTWSS